MVPFAWGQALFSVEVLRVYPNVQDLGVSARLSESRGTEEKRHFISCYEETWVVIKITNDKMLLITIHYTKSS